MSTNKTTYTAITAKIIFITLFFTLITSYTYSQYLKDEAITSLAQIDAKKTSRLVFESLYSAMQRGWSKDDLREIISRLNNVDDTLKVNVYRSEIVAEIYGEIQEDKLARESKQQVMKAMKGIESLNVSNNDYIQYYYPVTAKKDCLKCHTNAKTSDVLGVINVAYPVTELKISLTNMVNFFIIFILIFSLTVFVVIFLKLNKHLIRPIGNFVDTIKNITSSQNMATRVSVDDNVKELDSMKEVFNSMLDSIEYQFYYDNLTNLYNRRKLTEILEQHKPSFLMIINIDGFKKINDLYGDASGDILLKQFANFLREKIPINGSIYRLHSDEFAYLSQSQIDLKDFMISASYISESISKHAFVINEGNEVLLNVTIGMSYGTNMPLINADTALVIAKETKKDYLLYDESMEMTKEYEKNLTWTRRIKKAIEEDRIVPAFQPIVDVKTKKTVKFESLMRMVDEEGSLIAPIHFLELSKKNKLYHQLTKIMIEKTFKKFIDLPYIVSINISVEDILNEKIYNFILKQLSDTNIGDKIVFEIIESEGIENFEEVLEFITKVKTYGAKISIDDFGTGYSNFEYLMKLNVDYIKIDGSMIKHIDTNVDAQIITKTIISFAKNMNIQTIAEFVHSKNVFDKVLELDVDFAQGYYFGEATQTIQ